MQSNHPLKNSEILFHNIENQLYHKKQNPDEKFGILKIKVPPMIENMEHAKNIAIIFTIDTSASMSDYCSDNRRKLDHAVQTLIGIMRYLADNTKRPANTKITVAVLSFSTNIKHIIDFTTICEENLPSIIAAISGIYTQDSTNIEVALKEADRLLLEYSGEHPDTVLYHIQLTDGEVTDGEKDHQKLADMVNPSYTSIFVGFGKYYDDHLLCKLSENPRNDYRFIDKLEFSAVVYGEILYGILYHCYDTVVIESEDVEIYNWRKNEWSNRLRVNNLPYDCERVFQLRMGSDVFDSDVTVFLKPNGDDETMVYCYPELVDMESGEKEVRDLTIYSFRQRTQELLYEVREFVQKQKEDSELRRNSNAHDYFTQNEDLPLSIDVDVDTNTEQDRKRELYEKCCEFMRTMKEYMTANGLTDDRFMRLLQDDIYIVLKTLYRRNAHLWCANRHNSLGREHSYQPSHGIDALDMGSVLDLDESTTLCPRTPNRRRNRPRVFYTTQDPPIYTFPLFEHPLDTPDITGNYEMSQNFDTTMMSPSMARTIHAVNDVTETAVL